MTCSLCHMVRMERHPELNWFLKCPICGYSCMSPDLCAVDRVNAEREPFMRLPDVTAIALIERGQQDRFIKSLPPQKGKGNCNPADAESLPTMIVCVTVGKNGS